MKSINPANEQLIKEYQPDNFASVKEKLSDLQENFAVWKNIPLEKRAAVLTNAAQILETNKTTYAYIMTTEMGKIKSQAIAEVEKCAKVCRYYAENAQKFLAPINIATEHKKSYVIYSPLGVILGIMPWNFPFWQAFRFVAPTLLAGNVIVLKHASNVSGCALSLEDIFTEATQDLNIQIFKTILVGGDEIKQIIADPLVQAVSLTGSVDAGKSVASTAGTYLKKAVLELGGSDPYLVLKDADLDTAATMCAKGRLNNTGQSCVAAKRLIVVQDAYDKFLKLLTAYFSKLKVGDPNLDDVDIGPLANRQGFDTVVEQIASSIRAGAHCHFGGARVDEIGFYLQPTILTNIPKDSPAYNEEIFGPVACVFKVKNEAEALELANNTSFGLGGAIFTKDLDRAKELAEQHVQAGMVFVNTPVASDPRLPFGGIKHSGYGRELAEFGIHEFVNIKTIVIN